MWASDRPPIGTGAGRPHRWGTPGNKYSLSVNKEQGIFIDKK